MPFTLEEIAADDSPSIFNGIPFLEDIDNAFGVSEKSFMVTSYQDSESKYIKYYFPEETAEMISAGFNIPVWFSGKLIMRYNDSSDKWEFFYGYFTLKGKYGVFSKKVETKIPVVNVSATSKLELSSIVGATILIDKSGEGNSEYSGIIYFAPVAEASISVGTSEFNVTGYVEAEIPCELHTTGYLGIDATIEAGIKAKFVLYTKTILKKKLVDKHWDNGETPVVLLSSMMDDLSQETAEVMPRRYLDRGSEWVAGNESDMLLLASADNENPDIEELMTNIYPDSEVQYIRNGDDLWMIWTDDNPDRSSMNRTQLRYSVYDADKGEWSDSPAWIGEDKTADFSPTAASVSAESGSGV
jgi:hypothetical protein